MTVAACRAMAGRAALLVFDHRHESGYRQVPEDEDL